VSLFISISFFSFFLFSLCQRYEIAQSNAAYLLDRKMVSGSLLLSAGSSPVREDDMTLWALHFHQRAAEQDNAESFVAIGNA